MTGDPDLEVVRRAIEAFGMEPGAEFFDGFHPEHVEIVPLRAALEDTVYRGPDAPRRFVEGAREVWESLRLEVRELRRVGDRVLVLADARARSRDAGVDLEFEMAALFRLRDGRITHIHTFLDVGEAMAVVEAE